jgi:CheY-like chemotaxis protein
MALILVVEDDPILANSVCDLLKYEGHSVMHSANGIEALKMLGAGEKPALILLDLMMPEMNGWEFLRAVKDEPTLAAIPVIVTSRISEDDIRLISRPVVSKPYDVERLLGMVDRFCDTPEKIRARCA